MASGVVRKEGSATVHVVVGTGGVSNIWPESQWKERLHETWIPESAMPAWSEIRLSPVYGFLRFSVDKQILKCEFVDNSQGILDSFTITAHVGTGGQRL